MGGVELKMNRQYLQGENNHASSRECVTHGTIHSKQTSSQTVELSLPLGNNNFVMLKSE